MFSKALPLAFGLAAAGGLAQFPEFAQQYTQRVGGAYMEVQAIANGVRDDAANNGKTVAEAIDEYAAADSTFFQDRGRSIAEIMTRENYLRQHYTNLTKGDGFAQLTAFVKERDMDIAQQTLDIYKPAIPATFTGFAHGALGFLGVYFVLRFPFIFRRRRRVALA